MEDRLKKLIELCLTEQASTQDREELARLISEESYRPMAKTLLLRAYEENRDRLSLPAASRDAILAAIYRSAEPALAEPRRHFLPRASMIRIAVAASLLLLVSIGIYVYQQSRDPQPVGLVDFPPGGHRAILTLADGRTIQLDEDHEGIVIDSNVRYVDGTMILDGLDFEEDQADSVQLLTITTPKGGQYSVTLPDGSQVWLNAASSLTYPRQFAGRQRQVDLTGEAYFEIAHRRDVPFLVYTAGQTVEVLGTHFNINAYADESAIRTTLLEGSVRVSRAHSNDKQILVPGEQAILRDRYLQKEKANISEIMAWREGRFDFNGKNLEQVMRELARWYDIEVAYEGPIPAIEFWGGVFRNENLGTVLQILETNDLDYRLEDGRKLIIFKKQ